MMEEGEEMGGGGDDFHICRKQSESVLRYYCFLSCIIC